VNAVLYSYLACFACFFFRETGHTDTSKTKPQCLFCDQALTAEDDDAATDTYEYDSDTDAAAVGGGER